MDLVLMPQLGETVVEGTITAWAKAVGDAVAPDDTLFEVSTEKVDTEVPSAVAGFLRAVLVAEGDAVPIGTPVAVITATADEPFDPPSTTASPGSAGPPATAAPDASPYASNRRRIDADDPQVTTSRPGGSGHLGEIVDSAGGGSGSSTGSVGTVPPAPTAQSVESVETVETVETSVARSVESPVVRRLLAEHGLVLADVAGSGRNGRVTRNDVVAAAAQRARSARQQPGTTEPTDRSDRADRSGPPAPRPEPGPDDQVVPLSRARLATAEHLHRSVATAAHALVVVEVDWSEVDRARAASSAGLSYLPFVARAVVDGLHRFPHLNATFDRDRLIVHRRIHLGIAVDVDQEALLVPVVRDAHDLRIDALAEAIIGVADLARRHRLPGDAFDGGTFTLTNVGSYGTVLAAPIINQPQVAILSTDGIRMRPTAVADGHGGWAVAVRPVGNLSLSFDHRAVDGAYAAAFLAHLRDELQVRDWAAEVAR